ncbi:MAG TPA: riboflavin synthase [Planctomycetota bacterium]|nr:riboflavin synthase [Planctomycetota bacterium]
MFTGIVQHLGRVRSARRSGERLTLAAEAGPLAADARTGDSVCVNGVCLTVTGRSGDVLSFDVIGETLSRSTLGDLREGATVNLEPSLSPSDRLGGHFVTGHVDGVATLAERVESRGEVRLRFAAPPALTDMMIVKGSVALDGVSLTLTDVGEGTFTVALIPHTLEVTSLGALAAGGRVNLETDLIGKWVLKVLGTLGKKGTVPISEDFLREHGFA